MRAKRGFTLIEILIVVLIIGITAAMGVLAFGDFGASRKITLAAENFSNYLALVQQKAILESNTYGIKLRDKQYETYRFNDQGWQLFGNNTPFRIRRFPDGSFLVLQVPSRVTAKNQEPDIILYPSGELSPFTLSVGSSADIKLITVKGNANGELELKPGTV